MKGSYQWLCSLVITFLLAFTLGGLTFINIFKDGDVFWVLASEYNIKTTQRDAAHVCSEKSTRILVIIVLGDASVDIFEKNYEILQNRASDLCVLFALTHYDSGESFRSKWFYDNSDIVLKSNQHVYKFGIWALMNYTSIKSQYAIDYFWFLDEDILLDFFSLPAYMAVINKTRAIISMPSIRTVSKNEDYFGFKESYPGRDRFAIGRRSNHIENFTPVIQSDFWVWFHQLFPWSSEGANCEINMYWCSAAESWRKNGESPCVIVDITSVFHMHMKTSHEKFTEHRWGGKYAKQCATEAHNKLNNTFKRVFDGIVQTSPIGLD